MAFMMTATKYKQITGDVFYKIQENMMSPIEIEEKAAPPIASRGIRSVKKYFDAVFGIAMKLS